MPRSVGGQPILVSIPKGPSRLAGSNALVMPMNVISCGLLYFVFIVELPECKHHVSSVSIGSEPTLSGYALRFLFHLPSGRPSMKFSVVHFFQVACITQLSN